LALIAAKLHSHHPQDTFTRPLYGCRFGRGWNAPELPPISHPHPARCETQCRRATGIRRMRRPGCVFTFLCTFALPSERAPFGAHGGRVPTTSLLTRYSTACDAPDHELSFQKQPHVRGSPAGESTRGLLPHLRHSCRASCLCWSGQGDNE